MLMGVLVSAEGAGAGIENGLSRFMSGGPAGDAGGMAEPKSPGDDADAPGVADIFGGPNSAFEDGDDDGPGVVAGFAAPKKPEEGEGALGG